MQNSPLADKVRCKWSVGLQTVNAKCALGWQSANAKMDHLVVNQILAGAHAHVEKITQFWTYEEQHARLSDRSSQRS